MLATIKQTITENNLVEPTDGVLVALSGGPDSVALLYALHQLRTRMKLRLQAVYVNHQIRPRIARKEEQFCSELCDNLDIDFTIVSEDIPALARQVGKSLEETGRVFRYAIFDQIAEEEDLQKIATGHHADDQAETILFRILRGTGRSGLRGIPVKRDRIIRPLLDVNREQILAYLAEHKLTYCTDSSNTNTDFTRNLIRHKLLPIVRQRINPQVDSALINLAETTSAEDDFLNEIVQTTIPKVISSTPGGKLELAISRFSGYDIWLRRRLVRHCLSVLSVDGLQPGRDAVERFDKFCRGDQKGLSLPGKIRAVRHQAVVYLYRSGQKPFEITMGKIEPGTICPVDVIGKTIRVKSVKQYSGEVVQQKRPDRVMIDFEKLSLPLAVRSIKPGDRFRPLGMKGHKKIGDYLTDQKVPPPLRNEIPVVVDRNGPIWLVGHQIAERVKIDDHTGKVIELESN